MSVAKNRPTVMPTAISIMLAATLNTIVSREASPETATVVVPFTVEVEFVSSFAVLNPLRRLPVAAKPLGTCTKIAGNRAAAATPCLRRLYRLAHMPTARAPIVLQI